MPLVDIHSHMVPEHFPPVGNRAAGPWWPQMDHNALGKANFMTDGKNYRTLTNQNWSAEQRLKDMEADGVDAQAISPMPETLSYWFTPQDALDFGRYTNEQLMHMVQKFPKGKAYGLGMVPMQTPDVAAKELSELKKMGFRGVELGSNVNGKSLGESEFHDFYKEVERLDLCIFVHALRPTMIERLPEYGMIGVGYPTDTGLTIASLIMNGVIEKCPNIRIAFSHGGGTFPFLLPRLNNQWSGTWNEEPQAPLAPNAPVPPIRQALPKSPVTYARKLFYDDLLFEKPAIRFLVDYIGITQVVSGTDYPYFQREKPVGNTLRSMELTQTQIDQITWHNGMRFLGMKSGAA